MSQLSRRTPTQVDLAPDAAARKRIAAALDLVALPRLRLEGRIAPSEGDAFRFEGRLTAEVVQPCVVTLAPVTSGIDEPVARTWSPHAARPEGGEEAEMGDDELEPLGQAIDLGALMEEELSLALPPYPRAPGVEAEEEWSAGDDAEEPETRPFAGLADLLKKD
ncbi:DUF177 domain-containing protein [Paracoccus sp. S-4012]|uniref:YceD family protein n=1 Tax=Paracoccus sp. S-4012 TaxID=2665648 RepID=UPI00351B9FD7